MKRRLHVMWTCSDYTHHAHRWYVTAWLCGQIQRATKFVHFMLGSP